MFSSKITSILLLVAMVFVAVLIGLQVGEIMGYSAAPSVWPATP